MGRNLERRRYLFKKFSGQLLLLKAHGLLNVDFKYPDPYICPICLREFSEEHLDESKHKNYLTAEDAPPDSLGGKKIALTCRECNNGCGQKIDWHLTEAIRSIDDSQFYKGSKQHATIEFEGKKITIELESLGDGTLSAYHRKKSNNPSLLEKFIYGLKNKSIGPVLNISPPERRIDQRRISYALVKTNYIITFSKFGYIFLLGEHYAKMRKQLLNPDEDIYPWKPFLKDQFKKENAGTYYVLNENLKSILNVFVLTTPYSETTIAAFLESPMQSIREFGERIDREKTNEYLTLNTSNYDEDADLFNDIKEIKIIFNWFNSM